MKKIIILVALIISLPGCTSNSQMEPLDITATPDIVLARPAESRSGWAVYDADPDHIWNRVFRQLYQRTTQDGTEYGSEELDPLLWWDTTFLLEDDSHQQAIAVLDEFLSTHAESLIRDTLKRAMFQRDIWAVFDWLASQTEPYPAQRRDLEIRLAQIIKRVALPKNEIAALPDNFTLAVESGVFLPGVEVDHPERPFLPVDLFQPESAWVPVGREGGPVAMTHTEAFPFFGRSVFFVFVRSPNRRAETLDFIESLKNEPNPVTPIGSNVALARQMLLIDNEGQLILSPLVETIQIRHFSPAQAFHEFELDRSRLFEGVAGGLDLKNELFMLFMGHGDVFEIRDLPTLKATIPAICKGCHFEYPPIPNSGNTNSIISYSRQPFSLPDNERPVLFATTIEDEAQTVIVWKRNHPTWQTLEALWH